MKVKPQNKIENEILVTSILAVLDHFNNSAVQDIIN
jgi:hypothetical protein